MGLRKCAVPWNKPEKAAQEPSISDEIRVGKYIDDGGEIVDLTNRPRKENDGFAPDHELLTPFNRAHEGTKEGLAGIIGRKR
jgi:hypothetical protein